MSTRRGIRHPGVIDLVTRGDDALRLIVVEDRALVEDDAPALQEKLNTYLAFALDGALATQYPEAVGRPICIRVDLYAKPAKFVAQFLHRYAEAIAEHKVALEVSINGKLST